MSYIGRVLYILSSFTVAVIGQVEDIRRIER